MWGAMFTVVFNTAYIWFHQTLWADESDTHIQQHDNIKFIHVKMHETICKVYAKMFLIQTINHNAIQSHLCSCFFLILFFSASSRFLLILSSLKNTLGPGELSQWIKYLPGKCEDLSVYAQDSIKFWVCWSL